MSDQPENQPDLERPVTGPEDDQLDRGRFVNRLCDAVVNPKYKQATGIVIGLTGPWGSGKSSILNMTDATLKTMYGEQGIIVVRFDPWLVSGHEELISQFFGELVGTLNANKGIKSGAKKLIKAAQSYGAVVTPIGNFVAPGLGSLFGGLVSSADKFANRERSLPELRKQLIEAIDDLNMPIVVLIDELDRTEDAEVQAVARLVRSVMDLPNISYLIAYDAQRVCEALGNDNAERGRAYLEKIIQLQVALPILFDEEIRLLLEAELNSVRTDTSLPDGWEENERYLRLIGILVPKLIKTPRDVKRLVGTFHALSGMVGDEVNWADMIGIAVLEVKAPDIADTIRRSPDRVVENPVGEYEHMFELMSDKAPKVELLSRVIGNKDGTARSTSDYEALARLFEHLFPLFSDRTDKLTPGHDCVCYRRPLLTALRRGLVPGTIPRETIIRFLAKERSEKLQELMAKFDTGSVGAFIDRIEDIYTEPFDTDHLSLWLAISDFCKKPSSDWWREFSPMRDYVRAFSVMFDRGVLENDEFKSYGQTIFSALLENQDVSIVPNIVRSMMWYHGLFDCEQRGGKAVLYDANQAKKLSIELADQYKQLHLSKDWLPKLWTLQPVFIMLSVGVWDDKCRAKIDTLISDDRGLDGFVLMTHGGHYTTDRSTIERMITFDGFEDRLRTRLDQQGRDGPHETVRNAIEKFLGQW
ncbi:MAG: KAP family NTPase [Alphaproteobacteria bacterium]